MEKQDNFSQINNRLVEALAFADLSSREYKIIHAVIRLTLGFHRRTSFISVGVLCKMTGLDRGNISRALQRLIERKVIIQKQLPTHTQSREIGINLLIQQWASSVPTLQDLGVAPYIHDIAKMTEGAQTATVPVVRPAEAAVIETINEKALEIRKKRIPTLEECVQYFVANNESRQFGELFFHKHEQTGWKDGTEKPITNWHSRAKMYMIKAELRQSLLGDTNGTGKSNGNRGSASDGIELDKYEDIYRSSQGKG